jgi:hypothetical protein
MIHLIPRLTDVITDCYEWYQSYGVAGHTGSAAAMVAHHPYFHGPLIVRNDAAVGGSYLRIAASHYRSQTQLFTSLDLSQEYLNSLEKFSIEHNDEKGHNSSCFIQVYEFYRRNVTFTKSCEATGNGRGKWASKESCASTA